MHRRLFPKENKFSYKVYYIAFDVSQPEQLSDGGWFGLNRWGLSSFRYRDHGACDGSHPEDWAKSLVMQYGSDLGITRIVLVAMPRVLGYGFNPVSFWMCLDGDDLLRAVICEVHNTFGERHVYFCRNENGSEIQRSTSIEALKQFHVSPFMERNGHYRFKFDLREKGLSVWIDYFDKEGRKQLQTSVAGSFAEYNRRQRLLQFVKCPMLTFKVISTIHWQALRLFMKGIRYVPRPKQLAERVTPSGKITGS